jgi:uncharacterized membrane protein YbaN (DUF454 family)
MLSLLLAGSTFAWDFSASLIQSLPITAFLLTALRAFLISTARFHRWLYYHPTLCRTIRDRQQHKAIPLPVKIMAVTLLTPSVGIIFITTEGNFGLAMTLAAILSAVAFLSIPGPVVYMPRLTALFGPDPGSTPRF